MSYEEEIAWGVQQMLDADLQFPQENLYRKPIKTNADHIRSMTDEELAVFLECFSGCHYCSEHERLENEPLLRGERCDEDCEKHMLNWLKQPYSGGV